MKLWIGLMWTVLGTISGGAAALFGLTIAMRGNIFGIVLLGTVILPVGLVVGALVGLPFGLIAWQKQAKGEATQSRRSEVRRLAGVLAVDAAMLAVAVGCIVRPPDWLLIAKFYVARPYYEHLAAERFLSDANLDNGKPICVVEEWGEGFAAADDMAKGYVYTTAHPDHLVASLDHIKRPGPNGPCETYRHIEGHWYLYYQWIPDNAA